jgi:hypothetical protein
MEAGRVRRDELPEDAASVVRLALKRNEKATMSNQKTLLLTMIIACVAIFVIFMAPRPANATFFPGPSGNGVAPSGGGIPVPPISKQKADCIRRACPGGQGCSTLMKRCMQMR